MGDARHRRAGGAQVIRRHPYVLALVVIALVWGFFLIQAGTLFSGYQFVDDHEILRMDAAIHAPNGGVASTLWQWVGNDLKVRLRTGYYVHRVLLVSLIGTDFELWGLHQGGVGVLTAFLCFAFCMRLGFTWGQGMVFAFMALMGEQAAIFWRAGPAETVGTFMATLSLWFMGESVFATSRRRLWTVLFIVSAIIMALFKESFLLFLPALVFWRMWLTREGPPRITWRESVRQNLAPIIVLGAVCLCGVVFVRFFIGTTFAGYAGVERFDPFGALFKLYMAFKRFYVYLAVLGVVAAAAVVVVRERRVDWKGLSALREFGAVAILCGLVVFPQAMLYAKSGFFERYLIPAVFGFAFLLVWTLRWLAGRQRHVALAFMALLLAFGVYQTTVAYGDARRWAAAGRWNARFLGVVGRETQSHSRVLIVGDPARNQEAVLAMKSWLEAKLGCRNLYALRVFSPPYTPFEQGLIAGKEFFEWFPDRVFDQAAQAPPVDVVVVMVGADPAFLRERAPWLTADAYERFVIGGPTGFAVYARRK